MHTLAPSEVHVKFSSPAGVGANGTWASIGGSPDGIGVDPVFQLYSHLWDAGLVGEEQQYYNLTKVNCTSTLELCFCHGDILMAVAL